MDKPSDEPIIPHETAEELYENAPCGYISALPDGRIVRVNKTLLEQIGLERDEIVGRKRFQELLTIPGRVFYDTHFAPLIRMRGYVREISCDLRRSDGTPMPALVNAVQLTDPDGQPVLIRFMVFEATERRMYEADLLEARKKAERFAALVEISADAIISLDPSGTVTTWNSGARRIFGLNSSEAIGKKAWELADLDDFDFDSLLSELRAGRSVSMVRELTIFARDRPMWVSATFTPNIEAPGTLTDIFSIIRDITDVRAAEEARQQREILQSVVRMQEEERHRMARDLHDHLGQQATGIRLTLQSLIERAPHDLKNILEGVSEQAEQMDRDISLLAFEMRPSVLNSMDISEALRTYVERWAYRTGIDAEFRFLGRPDRLDLEIEANLYRVAQEALNNISKHAGASSVAVLLEVGDEDLSLIIEDNGRGFDPGRHQTDSGGGFGLSGMHDRAKLIGGELEIESTTGTGTTIYLRSPARFA